MWRCVLCMMIALAAAAQTPAVTSVTNATTLDARLSPGILAAVSGNFGVLPTNVSVSVGGKPGYVVAATTSQITVELPMDAPAGATALIVSANGATSVPFNIALDQYAPALAGRTGMSTGAGLAIYSSTGTQITGATPAHPGDQLITYAIGLGQTNPPTTTGPATGTYSTAVTPTVTVGGIPASVQFAGITPNSIGLYQVNFTVPAGLQGNQPLVLSIGGKSSVPVTLPLFGITAVVNNASFGSGNTISPGSIITVYANGLGGTNQGSGFPATNFQGVAVIINGRAAPIFHLNGTSNSIDLLVPNELPSSGTINVQLTTPTGTTSAYPVTVVPASPGLYRVNDPSNKNRFNVIAQFANTVWLAMPASTATALGLPSNCQLGGVNKLALCGEPAAPGDYLVLYLTGLGKATPRGDPSGVPLPTGVAPPADGSLLYQTVDTPNVTIGGLPAKVLYSGLVPGNAGLYQIDVQVPFGLAFGDDVPFTVWISGSATDTATIAVQPRF